MGLNTVLAKVGTHAACVGFSSLVYPAGDFRGEEKAVTADLAVPTFTKNVKVGPPDYCPRITPPVFLSHARGAVHPRRLTNPLHINSTQLARIRPLLKSESTNTQAASSPRTRSARQ